MIEVVSVLLAELKIKFHGIAPCIVLWKVWLHGSLLIKWLKVVPFWVLTTGCENSSQKSHRCYKYKGP